MSRLLGRLGGAAAAHPWRTLAVWLVALVAATGLSMAAGGTTHDDYDVPGIPSQEGSAFLEEHFPAMAGAGSRVVVHGDGAVPPDLLATLADRLAAMPHVSRVAPPRLSPDGDTALIEVGYSVPVTDFAGSEAVDALTGAAAPAEEAGFTVAFGGEVPENVSAPSGTAEVVGIVAALVILIAGLGSLVAAGLPILVALMGLGVGTALVTLLAALTEISTIAPTIATMVGLGVGIDYALFLVSRHVEALRAGLPPVGAAAHATATAGTSVLMAGLTVLVSLFGLNLSTLPVYASFAYATFATVGAVMVASVTLVPAMLGLAGRRVLPRRERLGLVRPVVRAPRTARWAAWVGERPVRSALVAVVVLLALAAPTLGMRTWPQDAGTQPESATTRVAYDLVAAEFGPGANGPVVLAMDASLAAEVAARLPGVPGVKAVAPPVTQGRAAVIAVEPETGPQDERTTELVRHLRATLPDGVMVTGVVAVFGDISDRLAERLWVVVAFVVALSLLLLTVLFRAPVVALKAAVMNLLSVAAAYGVITAVFQTDAGAALVGLPHGGAVSSWVPILMFTVLFGLSMDYEVFLLSRIREDYLATGDARGSVIRGLASTGRVISSAAAIMVAVFVGFALDPDVTVKTTGVGMAAAVLIDATLVRLVLVPATMALLGRANWWLPRWLDRLLPEVRHHDAAPIVSRSNESVLIKK
ncbi:MMPL family transporter [Herbidospora sp. NEAU-GS84]|uniref:MMPL family transporter n=1 Tax=Herbidospora solisilvae TaxID=2696284 RepID=A0A7C9JC08_9ACTN|nr:MMPL family transporter [Herbidospora solisilvae]NAS23064.1 MMPL family transporter [Herbidospora solisilvae]